MELVESNLSSQPLPFYVVRLDVLYISKDHPLANFCVTTNISINYTYRLNFN